MSNYRRNGSHRNGYDLISAGTGRQGYQSPRSESLNTDLEAFSNRPGPLRNHQLSPEQRVLRHRYLLAIDDRCLASSAWDRTLTGINRVDLRVHLNNESTVVIDNIPFHFVRL